MQTMMHRSHLLRQCNDRYLMQTKMLLSGGVNTPKKKKAAATKSSSGKKAKVAAALKPKKEGAAEIEVSANDKRIQVQTILAERAIDVIARHQKVQPSEVKEYRMAPKEAAAARAVALVYQREMSKAHNHRMAQLFTRTLMTKHAFDALPKDLQKEAMIPIKKSDIPVRDELSWLPSSSFMEVATGLADPKSVFSLPGAKPRTIYPEEGAVLDEKVVKVEKKKEITKEMQSMIDLTKSLSSIVETKPQPKKAAAPAPAGKGAAGGKDGKAPAGKGKDAAKDGATGSSANKGKAASTPSPAKKG